MGKIIACIDGSAHADSVCSLSAWASKKMESNISLLHVVAPHCDVAAKGNFSGSIGLGAKSELLKELTEIDETRGKIEQKKGQLMLDHAYGELSSAGIANVEIFHRRGSLVETISDMDQDAELVVMGKRGEDEAGAQDHLGSNLERVARAIHKPLLVSTIDSQEIKRFLIAYDGSETSKKAIDYVINSRLLKGLECHLLKVCEANFEAESILKQAEGKLKKAGFNVHAALRKGKSVKNIVADYVTENDINLLIIGAYGHSKIRNLILGSTTTALIHNSKIPVLLLS